MPEFSMTGGQSIEDQVAYMKKTLDWLLRNQDHLNVTQLFTEYCNIQSENGETVISGPVLTMSDNAGHLRLGMGWNGVDFSFNMYDKAGNLTMFLDASTGSAVFGGDIKTTKDAYIGNKLYIGNEESAVDKGIFFYDYGGLLSYISMDTSLNMGIVSALDLNLTVYRSFTLDTALDIDINTGINPLAEIRIGLSSVGNVILSSNSYINSVYPGALIATQGYVDGLISGIESSISSLSSSITSLDERISALEGAGP